MKSRDEHYMHPNERRVGRRVPDGTERYAPGDYGRNARGEWVGNVPGVGLGSMAKHDVVEHDDGTITVSPSILITTYDDDCEIRWHGYLERGVWQRTD